MRQISTKVSRKSRAEALELITRHLERTAWSRGGQILAASKNGRRTDGRIVASWPGARPSQLRAGARKLYDVTAAHVRREQLSAMPQFEAPAPKPTSAARPGPIKPVSHPTPAPAPRNVVLKTARTLLAHGKRLFSRKGGAK